MKKQIMLAAAAVLLLALALGVTFSGFTTESEARGVVTMGSVSLAVKQEPGETPTVLPGLRTERSLTVQNTGGAAAWIRVKLTSSFGDADLDSSADAILIEGVDPANWQYKDGYYYYLRVLEPGESTETLMSALRFAPELDNRYQGAELQLAVQAEATQVKNNGTSVWSADGWPVG